MSYRMQAYDQLYRQFDMGRRPYGYSRGYVRWRCAQLRRPWVEFMRSADLVLDIGGGYGNQAYHLPPQFNLDRYINIDVSRSMLSYSQGQRLVQMGESLPFKDGVFDCVTCSEVLEHVGDKGRVIREAYRVLKQGGHFFLSTPRTGWREDLYGGWPGWLLRLCKFADKRTRCFRSSAGFASPPGVIDVPSDETWLGNTLREAGFTVLKQYRADNHLPYGERFYWRWFCNLFVDPRKYGHCTVAICSK